MAHIRGDCMQKGLNALAKPQKALGAKGRSWRISDRTYKANCRKLRRMSGEKHQKGI